MPGEILVGIALLGLLSTTMLTVWQDYVQAHFLMLPGL
jgi:type II secretory pathway pseudopilin PulG